MKRHIILPLVLALSIGLCACGTASTAVVDTADDKADAAISQTEEEDVETDDADSDDSDMRSKLRSSVKRTTGGGEAAEITEEYEVASAGGEKKSNSNIVRRDVTPEMSFTKDDVAGYWKYDAYDVVYLALYDTGSFEIYDLETDDLTSAGTYEIAGNQIEMTPVGQEDADILFIDSLMRLKDDEGDILSPYRPVKSTQVASTDEVNRAGADDDVIYEDLGDGNTKIRSSSKGVWMSYPSTYVASAENDFLWMYDGDIGYVTARNISDEYYNYEGSDEDFIKQIATSYLEQDFAQIYGDAEGGQDDTFAWGEGNYLGSVGVNLWNSDYDISAKTTVFYSKFNDGTYEVVLINSFARYGDRDSIANVSKARIGGQR
ncbi:MAG: hypothetical protein K6G22_01435 [Lachnospiraceae bacterium]|nr:hypothetical protein [Lachnospiraceae bacterium]